MIKRLVCLLSAVMVAASSAFAADDIPWTVWESDSINVNAFATTLYSPGSDTSFIVNEDGTLSESLVEVDYNQAFCPAAVSTLISENNQFTYDRPTVTLQGTRSVTNGRVEHNYSFPSVDVNQHQIYVHFASDNLEPGFYEIAGGGVCEMFLVESGSAMHSLGTCLVNSLTVSQPDQGYVDALSFLPDSDYQFHCYVNVVQTGYVVMHFGFSNATTSWSGSGDSVAVNLRYVISNLSLRYRRVDPADVAALNQANQDAGNSMQDYDSTEQQFTQSMTDNFNKLNLQNFQFPSGLLSGFSLITSIFERIWNGMGEYQILFVFPLVLGIVLLLIGRISKFSGGQSSGRSSRGNDDA